MSESIVFTYDSELVPLVPVSLEVGRVTVVGKRVIFGGARDSAEGEDRGEATTAITGEEPGRLTGWCQTFIHRDHAQPDPTQCRVLITDGVAPGVFVEVFTSDDYEAETSRYERTFRYVRIETGTLLIEPHHGYRYEALLGRDDHAVRCHVFGLTDDDLAAFLDDLTITIPPS